MGTPTDLAYTAPVNERRRSGAWRPRFGALFEGALHQFEKRILLAALYFNAVLVIGTLGYRNLENWSWMDAVFMTVTTATSVGYQEVHPLSQGGRVFTMGLLFLSVIGLGLIWAVTTAFFVDLDLGIAFRKRRMMDNIDRMNGHYIVCGAGRMGRVIIDEMMRHRTPIVVVENSPERVEVLRESLPDLPIVEGDATLDATLEAVGVSRAKGIAASLCDDADNLFLCLTARTLNPQLEISARATSEETVAKMHRAGANHVVSPNVTGGARMAATLLKPTVVSFLDATTLANDLALRLEEAVVPAGSHLSGKSLAQAQIPQKTGLIVLAVQRGGAPAVYNPGPEEKLAAGDVMIVLGQTEQIKTLNAYTLR